MKFVVDESRIFCHNSKIINGDKRMILRYSVRSLIRHTLYGILGSIVGLSIASYGPILLEDIKYTYLFHNVTYLHGEITPDSTSMLNLYFNQLPIYSHVDVYINSPGGDVGAWIELMTTIHARHIRIHAIVAPQAWAGSAAALFALEAETLSLSDSSLFIFHTGSAIDPDTHKRIVLLPTSPNVMLAALARATIAENNIALKKCYITKEDMDKIMAGEDLFITGKQMKANIQACKDSGVL